MPDEHGVDGADSAFSFREKFFNRVLVSFGIVEAAVPNQHLHLRENVSCPFEFRTLVLRARIAQQGSPIVSPFLNTFEPSRRGWGRIWTGEEHLAGRRRLA